MEHEEVTELWQSKVRILKNKDEEERQSSRLSSQFNDFTPLYMTGVTDSGQSNLTC